MFRSPSAIAPASFSQRAYGVASQRSSEQRSLAGRISINQCTTRPWSFERDLLEYASAGVSTIGLSLEKIDRCGREKAIELFDQSPLKASSLNWIAGLTGANGYPLADTIDEGIDTLRLARELDVRTVVVITGPRNRHAWNHLRRLVSHSLRELSDYADRLGIQLAVMPMGPSYRERWSFLRSLHDSLSLVRQVNRANVGLVVNTAHVYRERGLPQVLSEACPHVFLARLSDCSGRPEHDNDQRWLGEGVVPVNAIAAALDDAGYAGYYEVDVWSRQLWESTPFRPLLKATRELTFGAPPPPAPHPAQFGSSV